MRRRWIPICVAIAVLLGALVWQWPHSSGAAASGPTASAARSGVSVDSAVSPGVGTTASEDLAKSLGTNHVQSTNQANAHEANATGSSASSVRSNERDNINTTEQAAPPEHLAILPIDHDQAMDLFADEIARQENGGGNENMRKLLEQFQRLSQSVDRADELRTNLQAWAAQYAASKREHFAIVTVECHSNLCRILIAENGIAYRSVGGAYKPISAPIFSMRGLQMSLSAQPWWREMRIEIAGAEERPIMQNGYTLYTIYLLLPVDS